MSPPPWEPVCARHTAIVLMSSHTHTHPCMFPVGGAVLVFLVPVTWTGLCPPPSLTTLAAQISFSISVCPETLTKGVQTTRSQLEPRLG